MVEQRQPLDEQLLFQGTGILRSLFLTVCSGGLKQKEPSEEVNSSENTELPTAHGTLGDASVWEEAQLRGSENWGAVLEQMCYRLRTDLATETREVLSVPSAKDAPSIVASAHR